mmetsp:Transcript_68842/g.161995  ORF Transcript_68842/g.161995 Transcript_68842/m.161995 type:complete len:329 (-) Transcript_68842:43-1029(-)
MAATCVCAADFPEGRVFVGRSDGLIQAFTIAENGVLGNEFGIHAHQGKVNGIKMATGWTLPAPTGAETELSPPSGAANGTVLVTYSEDKTIKVLDPFSRREVLMVMCAAPVSALAVVNQATVVVGLRTGQMSVIDLTKGAGSHVRLELPTAHVGGVSGIVPSGTSILTTGVDASLARWTLTPDGDTPLALAQRLEGHVVAICCVALCGNVADDEQVVVATGDSQGTLRLYVNGGSGLHVDVKAHSKAIVALKWLPDLGRLLSTSLDGTGHLWDIQHFTQPAAVNAEEPAAAAEDDGEAKMERRPSEGLGRALDATQQPGTAHPPLPTE